MTAWWDNRPFREEGNEEGFGREAGERVRAFHREVPGYAPTALLSMPALAGSLGLGAMYVKDESTRFGLGAFKGLGGSYCAARVMQERFGLPEPLSLEAIGHIPAEERERLLFVTATDGNHGRGVAWAARMLGARSLVLLPRGSARERVEHIREQGAETLVTGEDYDGTVRLADRMAKEAGGILVQDTAWEGYTRIPEWIMQGYLTLAVELEEQLPRRPTHLFLQAGVGSMAASLCAYARSVWGEDVTVIVAEAEAADCLYRTARAHDGRMHRTQGSMQTMMAGLCCGEPCLTAARRLMRQADFFLTMDEDMAETGMRTLARPPEGDPALESGESGASTAGLVVSLMRRRELLPVREALGLGPDSTVVCLSTEGATDRENYRRIVSAH